MPVTILVTGYYRHPKMLAANAASGGELAEVLWCRGLDYVNEQQNGGFIPKVMPAMLTPTKTAARIKGLVGAGLWIQVEGGWQVHDYFGWNRTPEELEELRRHRSAAGRKGAAKRWGGRLEDVTRLADVRGR